MVATDISSGPSDFKADAWHHLDVTYKNNVFAMLRAEKPDVIFHLAAI